MSAAIMPEENATKREGDFTCPPSRKECKALIGELVGMMLFVFIGVGTAHMQFRTSDASGNDASLLTISLAFGLGITCMVYATAGISGGHLNPAVTFTLMALGEISVGLGFLYVLMQMCGACLGALLATLADPFLTGFAINVVNPHICGLAVGRAFGSTNACCERFDCNIPENTALYDADTAIYEQNLLYEESEGHPSAPYKTAELMWGPAFVVEFIGTFLLCFTVLTTAVYKDSVAGNMAPFAIGLSVFFAHLIAIPITNCSINPARSFGAAVVASIFPYFDTSNGNLHPRVIQGWEHQIFFWGVPIVGGLFAALIFWAAFLDRGNEEKSTGFDVDPQEDNRGDGQGPKKHVGGGKSKKKAKDAPKEQELKEVAVQQEAEGKKTE